MSAIPLPFAAVVLAAMLPGLLLAQEEGTGPERWEPAIQAFEAADRGSPPPREGILFLGSSSVRLWELNRWFPGLPVINRGFGGSQIADSLHYLDRIAVPYAPRALVLYAGDNDIARGKRPERVLADYQALVARVHEALPDCRIHFISIKPSLARWRRVGEMRRANRLIERFSASDERLGYIDIDAASTTAMGTPRPELFRDDGLHLNDAGYAVWTEAVAPHLAAAEE